uniref:Uncharacterized protein n=1 Tax=Chlorobium phaeobacteroides (strain BS1) TaxID=331678 RepID=B3EPG8_CHLPB
MESGSPGAVGSLQLTVGNKDEDSLFVESLGGGSLLIVSVRMDAASSAA